jgi:hypothetical protein
MKRVCLLTVILVACIALGFQTAVAQQDSAPARVTLYAPLKYQHDQSRAFVDLQRQSLGSHGDLGYGSLYVREEFDWLQSSSAQGNRSVIKVLGPLSWTSDFKIPVVEPLRKLKPGEQRMIAIDASGADGKDGASTWPGRLDSAERASSGVLPDRNFDPRGGNEFAPTTPISIEPRRPSQPKHDGTLRVDPLFVRAIPGHIYVIHVVDDLRDFYALFRVEALQRGDQCTISWKSIPEPSRIP